MTTSKTPRSKSIDNAGQISAEVSPHDSAGATRSESRPEFDAAERPFVAGSTGHVFGYARVSSAEGRQSVDRQITELTSAGATRVFADHVSGSKTAGERTGWLELRSHLRAGDRVIVTELSRVGRTLVDVISTLDELQAAGIVVQIQGLGVLDGSPISRLITSILASVSELERKLIQERTISGLREARRRGVQLGRKASLSPEQIAGVIAMRSTGRSAAEVGLAFGVSERTIRRVSAKTAE